MSEKSGRGNNTDSSSTKSKLRKISGSKAPGSSSSSKTRNTESPPLNMGVEHKLLSSSREMRNLAEKMRRDKLNSYVNELAGIVPLGSGANKRIDKTSVLRLAANYIRMHKILKEDAETGPGRLPQMMTGNISHSLAEAIGGFLLVVTSSGKVIYVTEAVDQFFGHSQVDLLGHSIYNVIHPDDHEIIKQQLNCKENSRRSFFCRMMEKALSRNDPGRYEIIHIVGQLRPLPQAVVGVPASPVPASPSPSTSSAATCSDNDDNEDSDTDGESQTIKASARMGTHMLVGFVRVVKDRPITELSLVESTQDEYITRHGLDAKILYTDHRISFVTGLMPGEVLGTSAFTYMHPEDMVWSIVAQKLMLTSSQGQGIISYRLKRRDGAFITLRSRGFLEVHKQTGQVESFVCINTVLGKKEAGSEIKNQRRKLLPIVRCTESDDHLTSISSSLPPELLMALKQLMNPQAVQKLIDSIDEVEGTPSESHELPSIPSSPLTCITDDAMHHLSPTRKDEICNELSPFEKKLKRPCKDDPDKATQEDFQEQWQRVPKKRTAPDKYDIPSKRIPIDSEPPQPELLHANYKPNINQSPQYISNTSDQLNNIHSPTSVDEPRTKSISPGSYQQQQHVSSGRIHSTSPQSFEAADTRLSMINYRQSGTGNILSSDSYTQNNAESVPSHYDHSTSGSLSSPALYSHSRNYGLPSPSTYNQNNRGGLLSPGTCSQNRDNTVSPSRMYYQSRNAPGSYNQNINCDVPSPSNYAQSGNGSISLSPGSFNQRVVYGKTSSDTCNQIKSEHLSPLGNIQMNWNSDVKHQGIYNQGSLDSQLQSGTNMLMFDSCKEDKTSSCQQSRCESITLSKSYIGMFPKNQLCPQYSQAHTSKIQTFQQAQQPHLVQQYHQQTQKLTTCPQDPCHVIRGANFPRTSETYTEMQKLQQFMQQECTLQTANQLTEAPSSVKSTESSIAETLRCMGTAAPTISSHNVSLQCSANLQINASHNIQDNPSHPKNMPKKDQTLYKDQSETFQHMRNKSNEDKFLDQIQPSQSYCQNKGNL